MKEWKERWWSREGERGKESSVKRKRKKSKRRERGKEGLFCKTAGWRVTAKVGCAA